MNNNVVCSFDSMLKCTLLNINPLLYKTTQYIIVRNLYNNNNN